jgi:glycosyltransferase involved in cell wall biosynthesis
MHSEGSPARLLSAFPVAFLHWTLPPVAGGVETHLAEFVRLLAARGHPVTVFTGTGDLEHVPGVHTVRTEYLNLDRYSSGFIRGTVRQAADRFAVKLGAELDQRGIKIVHGHNLHHFTPVPAMAINALRHSMGLQAHHTYHSIWRSELGIAKLCRDWPGQYALSSYMVRECVAALGVSAIHTRPGVAHDRYNDVAPPRDDRDTHVILLPARLFPEKGAELAIRMLRSLRREGFSVRLILTTPSRTVDWEQSSAAFRAKIDRMIAASGLREHVEFRSVGFEKMPQLYAESDIVIYPSIYPEPLGLAPLEAAAAGRPVVVTDVGGLRETVVHESTGYVIPSHDVAALTARVRMLLADRMLARRMGVEGKRFVRRYFALEHYVNSMINCYRDPANPVESAAG